MSRLGLVITVLCAAATCFAFGLHLDIVANATLGALGGSLTANAILIAVNGIKI